MSNKKMLEIILKACLLIMFCFIPDTYAFCDDIQDVTKLILEGKISNKDVEKMEKELLKNPNDLSVRTILLAYYFYKPYESEQVAMKHHQHILWVIQNHPDAEIAGFPFCNLDPITDGKVYSKAKKLWLDQVETHKNNTAILGNAANFFILPDRDIAEDLLKQAKAHEPSNPEWSKRLGHLYSLNLSRKSDISKKEAALKSFEQLKKAFTNTSDEKKRFYQLAGLSMTAFEAGYIELASVYAKDLLNKAPRYQDNWNYGNAIHKGNLVLGRIALASGQLEEAKECLLKSGKTPGSPQLNSFGPNMTLAKELFEKSENEVVLQYLDLCRIFWKEHEDIIEKWKFEIQNGNMPDFGANLDY